MHNCAARVFLALVIAKVLLGELVDDSECRLEFLSPQPGDSVFDDDNLEVEVAMMDCMDISMNLQAAVHWNNERVVAFNGYIGRPPTLRSAEFGTDITHAATRRVFHPAAV